MSKPRLFGNGRHTKTFDVLDGDGLVKCKINLDVAPEESWEEEAIANFHGGVRLRETKVV